MKKLIWQSPAPFEGATRSHIVIGDEWKPGNTLCNSQGVHFVPTGYLDLDKYPPCKNCLIIEKKVVDRP